MIIDTETKIIIHINDGYFATLKIQDNPDLPEVGFNIVYKEEDKEYCNLMLPDELIDPLINALKTYKENKNSRGAK